MNINVKTIEDGWCVTITDGEGNAERTTINNVEQVDGLIANCQSELTKWQQVKEVIEGLNNEDD